MTDTQPLDRVLPELPAARPAPERWRTAARTIGEVLVTGGLVVLLFAVYELFVTDVITAQRQDVLSEELREDWNGSTPVVPVHESKLGDAFAVLHIPRFGLDYERVVLEGTEEEQLSQGRATTSTPRCRGSRGTCPSPVTAWARGPPFWTSTC